MARRNPCVKNPQQFEIWRKASTFGPGAPVDVASSAQEAKQKLAQHKQFAKDSGFGSALKFFIVDKSKFRNPDFAHVDGTAGLATSVYAGLKGFANPDGEFLIIRDDSSVFGPSVTVAKARTREQADIKLAAIKQKVKDAGYHNEKFHLVTEGIAPEAMTPVADMLIEKYKSKRPGYRPAVSREERRSWGWNNPDFAHVDRVAGLATSVYSGLKAFGYMNPGQACYFCRHPLAPGQDICPKCYAGNSKHENPLTPKELRKLEGIRKRHLAVAESSMNLAEANERIGTPEYLRAALREEKAANYYGGMADGIAKASKSVRHTASRRANPAKVEQADVKVLDQFIAKDNGLSKMAQAVSTRLLRRIRSGHYQTAHARREFGRLVDAGAKKCGPPSRFPKALRVHMTVCVVREFEKRHKIRAKNPSIAVVGMAMNPGPSRDRGFKGEVSLAEARKIAVAQGMGKQFDLNVKAHKKFHGVAPTKVRVYQVPDGKKQVTTEVGSISGRTPEVTYLAGMVKGSNKENKLYVHETSAKAMPILVHQAHKGTDMTIGGAMVRKDWYRK